MKLGIKCYVRKYVDTCIDELCKRAKFIKYCADASSVPGLCKQFVDRFYSVIFFSNYFVCGIRESVDSM